MWYEALIPMGIIGVALTVPQGVNYVLNYLRYDGRPNRRLFLEPEHLFHKARDERISGENKYWMAKGLENIPDED